MDIETVSTPVTPAPAIPAPPPGIIIVEGKQYMRDAKGALFPASLVKPVDKLMDEVVRKVMGHTVDLNAQIARFYAHCMDDILGFQGLIAQEYEAKIGGEKGNITLTSFDGTMQVRLQVTDRTTFGPELQVAKAKIDECLTEWTEGSTDELRAIVNRAFNVDQEGKVNKAELYMLMRADIRDPRWLKAMEAIRDSIRILGTKEYIRFYRREHGSSKWEPVTIDLASAA